MAEQMKNLSEEILASYRERAAAFQQRLTENAELVKEVQKTLDGFRNDHMEMAAALRAGAANLRSSLAKGEKDRIKSFNQLMGKIHGSISQIENEVVGIKDSTAEMLRDFAVSHADMTAGLNEDLARAEANRENWNKDRLKTFDNLMLGIHKEIRKVQKDVAGIFGYTDKLLKRFTKEHSTMSETLRAELTANLNERIDYTKNLLLQFDKRLAEVSKENQKMAKALMLDLQKSRKELSQSDVKRLKDFRVTYTAIRKRVNEIQKFVDTFLGEFSSDRKQAAETWNKLAEAIAKLDKVFGNIQVEKPEPVKKEKPAVKIEVPPRKAVKETELTETAAVKEEPVFAEPPKTLTLEEKVLDYINTHRNGIKVGDMEGPFGESRMRLGFITKKLMDEGKVQKIDNLYYPVAKK